MNRLVSNPRFRLIFAVLALMLTTLLLVVNFASGQVLVGIRNSLVAEIGQQQDFDWTPDNPPKNFLLESSTPPPGLQNAIDKALADTESSLDYFDKGLLLSKHINQGPRTSGEGIRLNTYDTYKAILTEQRGYCSDFSQVMNGLAYITKVPIREWGMSFEAFSGDGHAFNEIYSNRLNKWVFVDSYYSFYVTDRSSGIPLSAMEFQAFLRTSYDSNQVTVHPIVESHFKFKTAKRALKYYKEGADQFFLYMGNNVFENDNHPLLKFAGAISSAAEQSLAILIGLHPEIRIIATDTNQGEIDKMYSNRNLFFSLLSIELLLLLYLAYYMISRRKA